MPPSPGCRSLTPCGVVCSSGFGTDFTGPGRLCCDRTCSGHARGVEPPAVVDRGVLAVSAQRLTPKPFGTIGFWSVRCTIRTAILTDGSPIGRRQSCGPMRLTHSVGRHCRSSHAALLSRGIGTPLRRLRRRKRGPAREAIPPNGICDNGSCDNGSCGNGSCDNGSCNDGSCNDGLVIAAHNNVCAALAGG